MKKSIIFTLIFITLISFFVGLYVVDRQHTYNRQKKDIIEKQKENKKKLILDIKKHYNIYVKTNQKTPFYKLEKGKYNKVGTVKEGMSLILKKSLTITDTSLYLPLEESNYYVFYKNVDKIESLPSTNRDYKNYIPFGESVVLKRTKLYQREEAIYDLNESITAPILVKDGNRKYIEYNNDLYYAKDEDIEKIITSTSTEKYAKKMTVLNYHFFYNDGDARCSEIMCVKKSKFDEQMKYLSDNNYYTPTMKEFEWFMDQKVRLPIKSTLITVDDGAYGTDTVLPEILEKYKKRASLFLITGFNDKNKFISPNMELHSHSNLMHTAGVCPGGQGGGIKCLPEEKVLADLKITRDLLNQTSAFAYPFYEYNARAIELLKKAGFTMAFIGGNKSAVPGMDKMIIPRFPVVSTSSLNDFIRKIS